MRNWGSFALLGLLSCATAGYEVHAVAPSPDGEVRIVVSKLCVISDCSLRVTLESDGARPETLFEAKGEHIPGPCEVAWTGQIVAVFVYDYLGPPVFVAYDYRKRQTVDMKVSAIKAMIGDTVCARYNLIGKDLSEGGLSWLTSNVGIERYWSGFEEQGWRELPPVESRTSDR